jgi:large subunit ribosomal protein L49
MALPRSSTLSRFLGIAHASSTSIPPPPASSPKPAERNYWVTKTGTKGIPVYQLSKRGGNLHQTKVRRIEGDIMALKTDLQRALGLEDEEIVINHLTQNIIIKVHMEIKHGRG